MREQASRQAVSGARTPHELAGLQVHLDVVKDGAGGQAGQGAEVADKGMEKARAYVHPGGCLEGGGGTGLCGERAERVLLERVCGGLMVLRAFVNVNFIRLLGTKVVEKRECR